MKKVLEEVKLEEKKIWWRRTPALASDHWRVVLLMCSSGGQTLEPENIMWKDQKNRHGKWYSGGSSWGKQRRQRGRRPGHRTEYSAHVFNVKTSPAGSCSIFPQSTWALCPKRWDFLCIQVTGCHIVFLILLCLFLFLQIWSWDLIEICWQISHKRFGFYTTEQKYQQKIAKFRLCNSSKTLS